MRGGRERRSPDLIMYSLGATLLVLVTSLGGSSEMGSGADWDWDWRAAAAYVLRCLEAERESEDGERLETAMQSEHTRGWREDPIFDIKSIPLSIFFSFQTTYKFQERHLRIKEAAALLPLLLAVISQSSSNLKYQQ